MCHPHEMYVDASTVSNLDPAMRRLSLSTFVVASRAVFTRRLVPPSQAPSRSISFRWAVCNKDSPTRACTWVRVFPSGCRKVTLTFCASAATVGPPCHRIPVVVVVGIKAVVVTTDGGPAALVRNRICFERSFTFDVPRIFFFEGSKYVFIVALLLSASSHPAHHRSALLCSRGCSATEEDHAVVEVRRVTFMTSFYLSYSSSTRSDTRLAKLILHVCSGVL